jgi:oligoribonuclease
MSEKLAGQPKKLFWIDLEMTGLDIEKEVIIECAALITDLDFKVVDSFEAVVKQPQHFIDHMDDWNREHHKASGLTAKIPNGLPSDEVEYHLISMVQKHFGRNERAILCGNSIAQDRLFIDKYWPGFAELLHYRVVDVSSWKVIFNAKYNKKFEKRNGHRALDDIKESIAELQFYLGFLKIT